MLFRSEAEPAIGHTFAGADRRVARRDDRGGLEPRDSAGLRAVIAEVDATGESGKVGLGREALDLGPVFPGMSVLRVEQAGIEAGLVAEQEQAFGVGVEPAKRIDARRQPEVRESAPARAGFGRELREHAIGFMEGEEQAGGK